MRFVVGLMFDNSLQTVVLIRKTKPKWQVGKLNGVGGKIEDGESEIASMVREFHEETGVVTQPHIWQPFLKMHGKENGDNGRVTGQFEVIFFCAYGFVSVVKTTTDEVVEKHSVRDVMAGNCATLENIPWVIGLAVDFLKDGRPSFTVANYD